MQKTQLIDSCIYLGHAAAARRRGRAGELGIFQAYIDNKRQLIV